MSSDPFVAAMERWLEVSMRNSMRNYLHYARENGLSMSHLGAIFFIFRHGSCGVSEVGDHLGVTSAAASQMLDRMVQQGLVLRTEDPADRRVKRIALSEEGQRILDESMVARQSWLDDLAETLSESEKETLTNDLTMLISKVNQLNHSLVS